MPTKRRLQRAKIFDDRDYFSNDGMLTSIWGPGTWHFLHTLSFNYPVEPSATQKRQYREFILGLQHVLPCGKCRDNLTKTMRSFPLTMKDMENRATFSKYIYSLHEKVNHLLKKKSGLKYDQVRERYEHFRARCFTEKVKVKHKGCVQPLYGSKAKCVLKIVPQKTRCKSLEIDKECLKQKV